MHIVIDAINFNENIRGPDRYLIGLLDGLANVDNNNSYTILYAPWQNHYEKIVLPDNFEFMLCTAPRNPYLRVFWHVITLPKIIGNIQADIVHLPNIIFAPRLKIPVVMTVHDLAHFRFPEKFGRVRVYLQRLLIQMALDHADHVIAVSTYTKNDIKRFVNYPMIKTSVILEGGPEATDFQVTRSHPPYFLYVGQIERSKNVERLIKAYFSSNLLMEQGVQLWIAGRMGNAAPEIEHLLDEYNQDGRTRLLGYVDDNALAGLYAGCIAFVFPSLVEGFGLVLLEAMAYGAPIIASSASVIPEVVQDGGLLIDATNTSMIQAAMERVYQDPDLRQALKRSGRERLKAFSWRQAANETLAVYKNVLG